MCNLHYETMLNISRKILKSLIVNVDFQSSNYCIPHRHRLLGQTTKQSLSNFESKKSWKYKQLQKLRPEHSCLWIKVSVQQKCEKKYLQKKVRKGPASLLKISLWGSSVSTCGNESPGFTISRASTPNGLFQTIDELKRLVSYSKRFHYQSWTFC